MRASVRWTQSELERVCVAIWPNISIWDTHGEEILCYVGVIDPKLVVFFGL